MVVGGRDTEQGADPGAVGRRVESDEGGVAVENLLDVERLGVAGALFCVVGREGGEELEDALALGHGGEGDLLASALVGARGDVAAAPAGRRGLGRG